MRSSTTRLVALFAAIAATAPWPARAQGSTVYRCPGNLYTSEISAKEAQDRGCRTIEGAPVTVVQGQRPRAGTPVPPASGAAARPADSRVDPSAQRARDNDSRRILESELKKEEDQLAQMRKDYNNGEPDRLGDEKNYAKYQERVAGMKAAIERKENDVAALRREIGKLPP